MQTSQYAGFVDDKSEWGNFELRPLNTHLINFTYLHPLYYNSKYVDTLQVLN